ncbi:Retrovirus-related Pol polyprotein from transposon TNT 1-94 [Podosphaera aphanis]|nr:Retrovirus-related Pol polyprotein from transposon TNT 1-94 [Podosphaera aphanis]
MEKSLGQIVELTTPYNPEQDGQSERSIGILGTRTRAVILDQKIPQFLWPEIMRTQIYIVNRVATSVLQNETPFQALNRLTLGNDEIPDLSHLRVLGCKVYVQIPIEKRVLSRKLDARAEIGILVGYEGSHIFRVYFPSRKIVIRSSNIRFDEDGYITSPPNELPSDLGEPEFSENRGESKNEEIFEKSDESPCLKSPSPFEELAHGRRNLDEENIIEENLTEEVSRPSRSKKIYERASRVTRSGNSIIATPPSPDETIAFASFLAATSSTRDPKSVSEALNGLDSSDWRRAFKKEYDSLRKNNTWTYLERSEVPKEEEILKRKVRWVVRGFEQLYGRDYTQTYAEVCRTASWKIAIAMAAMFDLEIDQMDAVSAFLDSSSDDNIYVELPPMWSVPDLKELDDPVCKPLKALYGLKQAPRLWQNHLRLKLSEVGLTPLKSDNCIYRQKSTGILVVTYVDDFLIIGKDRSKIDELKDKLSKKFDPDNLGIANYFLGVRIVRDRKLRRIYLCQDAYIKQILERYSLENSGTVDCPSASGSDIHMVKFEGIATASEISEQQSKIGSLLYLAVHTRPDIAYQCSTLSRFLNNPSPQHIKAANRVFHYLAGTINLCIVYDGMLGVRQSKLYSFTDSDWGGCRNTRISTGGSIFFLAGGIISASTKRQSSVSLSSTEAEYYALGACIQGLLWIQQIMGQMQYKGNDIIKTRVCTDNQSSIALSGNPELHQRTKHIDIKHHFIRSHIANGSVDIKYISTKEMAADGLTKPLSAASHKEFVKMLHMEEFDCQI